MIRAYRRAESGVLVLVVAVVIIARWLVVVTSRNRGMRGHGR